MEKMRNFLILFVFCSITFVVSCDTTKEVITLSENPSLIAPTSTDDSNNATSVDKLSSFEDSLDEKLFIATDTCKKINSKEDRQLCYTMVKENDLDQDASPKEFSYITSRIDLNNDGRKDAIIWINDRCGTSGCPFYFYQKTKKGFRRVFEEFAWTPILELKRSKNSWKNMAYQIAGGGVKPYFVVLQFNGKSYKHLKSQKIRPKGKVVLDRNWKSSFFGPIPNQP
jgi:hypothetical protein